MPHDYSTGWVVSRNLEALAMRRTQAEAREWMRERGYQDEDSELSNFVVVHETFGPAIG